MLGSVSLSFHETELFKTYIFAGDILLIYLLALMMVLDIITGLMKAWKNKNLWSRKSMFGFMRKLVVFFVIILANVIDNVFGFNGVVLYATIIFYIGNEFLSIVENAGQIGMPIPPKLLEVLSVIREEDKSNPLESIQNDLIGTNKDGSDEPK